MTYRCIVVHLDAGSAADARIDAAAGLAAAHDAHLVGLAVVPPLHVPGVAHAEVVVQILTEQWEREGRDARARAADFEQRARRAGVRHVETRVTDGDAARIMALHARYADLCVVSQPDDLEQAGPAARFAEAIVLAAGRPVLVLPTANAVDTLGERVMIAWNAGREATRAVTDALPLLRKARKVRVVTVDAEPGAGGHGEMPGADIALYLARHGVETAVEQTHAGDVEVGAWLLSRAADFGADLIVMGAYGHSRLREFVLGGVTRTMLETMTVPVLMSH